MKGGLEDSGRKRYPALIEAMKILTKSDALLSLRRQRLAL